MVFFTSFLVHESVITDPVATSTNLPMEAVISTVSVASDSVVVTVRIGQSTAAHSVPLILAQIIKQSMNNDLLHSMYLTQSLRVDEIHQVIVSTIEQNMFYMIFGLRATFLVL